MGRHQVNDKACLIGGLGQASSLSKKNTDEAYLIRDSDARFVLNLPASVAPVAPTYLLPHSMRLHRSFWHLGVPLHFGK